MKNIRLVNNRKNEDLVKRYAVGKRLSRARNIPSKNFINFDVETNPITILCSIKGSSNNNYIVNILENESNTFLVIHDCPDYKKGYNFCKHILKTLLVIDHEVCKKIVGNYKNIKFSSNFADIKRSKQENSAQKANKLIKEKKYLEAIEFLSQAYRQSKNLDYISRILNLSTEKDLPGQFIQYIVQHEQFIRKNSASFPKIINSIISKIDSYIFENLVGIFIKIQLLLLKLEEVERTRLLNQINFSEIENTILKFILLHKFQNKLSLEPFFIKCREFENHKDLSNKAIKKKITNIVKSEIQRAITNLDSKPYVQALMDIANNLQVKDSVVSTSELIDYKTKIENLYREGLKQKHAALRSLVISNTKTDKLEEIKFHYKYQFPTILWSNVKKNKSPLYYYILQKCGFEKHHLDYISINYFVENYPVFKHIFNSNNPLEREVKQFWKDENPSIQNTAYTHDTGELNFHLRLKDVKKYILIEWDLAQKPVLGSYICQFNDGFIIPEKDNPLTYEIKPFDLILCLKEPITIKPSNIKIFRPIRKLGIKTAIDLVYEGIVYVCSYLPFNIVADLKNHKIDEIDAYNRINQQFENIFSPKKDRFKYHFNKLMQEKVSADYNHFYQKIRNQSHSENKILNLIGFKRYKTIFRDENTVLEFSKTPLNRDCLQELRYDFKKFITAKLIDSIKNKKYHEINLKNLKSFPEFKKWTLKIIYDLKDELENSKIIKIKNGLYDISDLMRNEYGKKIVDALEIIKVEKVKNNKKMQGKFLITIEDLEKILKNLEFLRIDNPEVLSVISV
ncbi:MAG: hypothetical protein BAJALOKI3v1_280033 [Promethearchaeota archaeon]|nr:MAG: hypothetical protein BAJALOKI3v1_280033 [Candidatus Lokiarchaeota archaeon]